MLKLYTTKSSGNGYKVRLLLHLLGVKHEQVFLDTTKGENKAPAYLAVSPRGQVPAIDDEGFVVWDSAACMVYLARKHGADKWLPSDARGEAEVMQWMALAGNEIQYGIQYARGILKGIRTGVFEEYQPRGKQALDVLEGRLKNNDWLALGRPTIADIACHSYVAQAPEANLPLDAYPGIRAWLARIEKLPGWVSRVQ